MTGNSETRVAAGGGRRVPLDRLKRAGPREARKLAAHPGPVPPGPVTEIAQQGRVFPF